MIFQRICFKTVPAPSANVLLALGEPFNTTAVLEAVQDAATTRSPGSGDFECLLLDPAANPQQLADAQEWLGAPTPHDVPARRVIIDKTQKSWFQQRSTRVLLCAPAAQTSELLAAAAECRCSERELAALEKEVSANWARAEADLPLVNVVGAADLKRMAELSGTARELWQRRIRLARIVNTLAAPSAALTPRAQRFGKRLRRAMSIARRTEILDGQLEVFEYIYEIISQRMGEYQNFRHGFIIEVLIVVLLALELLVMTCDLWRGRH